MNLDTRLALGGLGFLLVLIGIAILHVGQDERKR